MAGPQLGVAAPGVFTAQDVELIKRKFDRTCEELGVFAEDEEARRSLGRALVGAAVRGDIDWSGAPDEIGPTEVERVHFEGEELTVRVPVRR